MPLIHLPQSNKGIDKPFIIEKLRKDIANYRVEVVEIAKSESKEFENIELNLDSLQSFLDETFPDKFKHIGMTSELVDEFSSFNIGLKELVSSYEKVKHYLVYVEDEFVQRIGNYPFNSLQVGAITNVVLLTNENYFIKYKMVKYLKNIFVYIKYLMELNNAKK